MADKYAAKGAQLHVEDPQNPGQWLLVPSFRDGTQSGGEAERIDVTTHDSPGGRREFRAGFKGESTYSFGIVYDPANAVHQYLAVLYDSGDTVNWRIVLVDTAASEILFAGYVSNFPIPNLPIDGPMDMSPSVQVTGDIEFPGLGSS